MKIVHVASELFPYVKTGGLADAVASLTGMLADTGHDVSVFLPGYRAALEHRDAAGAERRYRLKIEMGHQYLSGDVRVFSPRPNLTVHLICREEFFDRRAPYGNGERDYEDNADRFIFFCKGVVEALRLSDVQADVVHAHDWQAALLPLLLREAERRQGAMLAMKTIFTIHNLAFQGVFPRSVFARTNLPDELNSVDGLEYYEQINFMKAGLLFADRLTTVSPRYAQEIQTPEFGCGLDGVVQMREGDIVGLLNGVDTKIWNPATDPMLPARYTADELAGKQTCRQELLKRFGFDPDFDGPVFGMVCRLAEQKGLDLVLANQGFFLTQSCRVIVLGSGEPRYEEAIKALVARAPTKIALSVRLDEPMSHLIEAGADFFLMPSLFEPCGLNQMYSQIYGTIPIVSRVGGLADTVIDADEQPEKGTGLMCEPTSESLLDALNRALTLYRNKARFTAVQQRAMRREFSWKVAAAGYERLYREAL